MCDVQVSFLPPQKGNREAGKMLMKGVRIMEALEQHQQEKRLICLKWTA